MLIVLWDCHTSFVSTGSVSPRNDSQPTTSLLYYAKVSILDLVDELHPTYLNDSIVIGGKWHELDSYHTCDFCMSIVSWELDLDDDFLSFSDFVDLVWDTSLRASHMSWAWCIGSDCSSYVLRCAHLWYIPDTDTQPELFFILLYADSRFTDYFWFDLSRHIERDPTRSGDFYSYLTSQLIFKKLLYTCLGKFGYSVVLHARGADLIGGHHYDTVTKVVHLVSRLIGEEIFDEDNRTS